MQLLRARERVARIVAVRGCLPDARDLFVGRRFLVLRAVDAELRLDLPELALGAVERELQLARIEAHEHVAGPHFGAKLHRHIAHDAGDFAADAGLIGESSVPDRSTSRWIDRRSTLTVSTATAAPPRPRPPAPGV